MQLGFVSAIVPELSLEEVFETGAASGYECVELMCWPPGKADRRYAGVTHIDVTALGPDDVARIWDLAGTHGMGISGLGYYPNPLTPDAAESEMAIKHLKKVIAAAQMFHLPVVSTFVGRDWTKSVDQNWPRFLTVWKDLIAHAEDHGIKIAIENCPMLFTADEWPGGKNLGSSPALWRRMFHDIPSPMFGLNYDPSHLLWQQMDYTKPLFEFSSRIFRVHLKDATVDRDRLNDVGVLAHPLDYHSPRLPAEGDINWEHFMMSLRSSGYDGPVCVEIEDKRYESSLAGRKEALIRCARNMHPVVKASAVV